MKLFMLLTFFGGLVLALGYSAFDSYKQYRNLRAQLDWSYLSSDEVRDLSTPSDRSEKIKRLQTYRARLFPSTRMEYMSDLIQAFSADNPRVIRERQSLFLRNELEFQKYARTQMDYHDHKLIYTCGLSAIALGLGYFMLQLFMQRFVLRPMHSLSRKMTDFLNDRYTYQFNVPGNDEFGQMQSTFNSLAQRVISNMEQLRTLDQAKSDFLSIASHELRTPLTSIKGSLSLMKTGVVGPMNEMAENLLNIAEMETDRLIRLINDILDLAKIEAGKLPIVLDWHPLNDLVETNLKSLSGLAQAAGVQLKMGDIPPMEAKMDKDRIQQVLTNLLSNAIKYSPKGKAVTVSCSINDQHQLMIAVQDLGRGIDPVDQELIFEKFRQATSPKNPLVKGTGLGLAIAKALVEEHGGDIGVRSIPGEGSVFYFTLPEWRNAHALKHQEAA